MNELEALINLVAEVITFIEKSEEVQPSNSLVEKFLLRVKEDALEDPALEDVERGIISDDDIKELINIVLVQRKNKNKKREIWELVDAIFRGESYGYKWRYGSERECFSLELESVFEIVYGYLPPYPRGLREPKEYPLEKIKELREKGLSVRRIAKEVGISKSTIHRLLKEV